MPTKDHNYLINSLSMMFGSNFFFRVLELEVDLFRLSSHFRASTIVLLLSFRVKSIEFYKFSFHIPERYFWIFSHFTMISDCWSKASFNFDVNLTNYDCISCLFSLFLLLSILIFFFSTPIFFFSFFSKSYNFFMHYFSLSSSI